MKTRRWLTGVLLLVALATGGGFLLRREENAARRREIALLRDDTRELERWRDRIRQLRAEQTPAAEVERLRSDHGALAGLQAEIDAMKAKLDARAAALSVPVEVPKPPPPATQVLLQVDAAGAMTFNGQPATAAALREQLVQLAGPSRSVVFTIRQPAEGQRLDTERLDAAFKEVGVAAKELGLRATFRFERAGK